MNNILDIKQELVIYAITAPDTGHVALNCSTIRRYINLGKRVLFYSLEQSKDIMLKRIGLTNTSNLLIKDKLLDGNIENIASTIDSFKPDIVIIDYPILSNHYIKLDDVIIFNRMVLRYKIPFIVAIPITATANKGIDFTTITLDEFKEVNSNSTPLIEEADRFILFYQKGPKEYMLRELTNTFREPKEFDIRELLN